MSYRNHRLYGWLSEVRRDFHRHPEVAYEEFRTTDRIKEILTGLDIPLTELKSPATGAVGVVACRPGEKVMALRADIDALTMDELSEAPYRSAHPGKMHACGHDGHTAIMLGVAKQLMETGLKNELRGTVKFIFQPAEEGVSGAREMITHGVLENPPVDRIVAGHMWPELKAGQIGIYRQASHASADRFSLTITGKGAHGGRPHLGIDPVLAGSHFVTAVHSIVSRNLDPVQPAVISVGQFVSGTTANVIPQTAFLQGTVRTFDEQVRQSIKLRIGDLAASLERGFGVTADLAYLDGVPPCINDPEVAQSLYDASVKIVGTENVFWLAPQTGAEDFALYVQQVPGAIIRVGCANPDQGIDKPLHSPYFDMDEEALVVGVEVFTQAMRAYLS
jgi:amidohydrolase